MPDHIDPTTNRLHEIMIQNIAAVRFLMDPENFDQMPAEEWNMALGILSTTADTAWRLAENSRPSGGGGVGSAQAEGEQVWHQQETERMGLVIERMKAEAERTVAERERLRVEVERLNAETKRIRADEGLAKAQTERMRVELQKANTEAARERERLGGFDAETGW